MREEFDSASLAALRRRRGDADTSTSSLNPRLALRAGMTRTFSVIADASAWLGVRDASARAAMQDLVVALARFLLADEFERVAQRLDGRLDRGFDVLALQLEAVDLALDVFEPRLRLLEQQLRARLRPRG